MRHEVARTVVWYGHILNKPAVPSAASIGTSATGNGRVGSCRDNVSPSARCGNNREVVSVTASVKAVRELDGMTRPTELGPLRSRRNSKPRTAPRSGCALCMRAKPKSKGRPTRLTRSGRTTSRNVRSTRSSALPASKPGVNRSDTDSAHAGLCCGLSRMRGNSQVRF